MKLFNRTALVSVVCAAAVGFGGVGTSYAATQSPAAASAAAESVSEQQIAELATYLQAIDEGQLLDSNGNFDREATTAKFGTEFADKVAAEVERQQPKASDSTGKRVKRSYGSCLLKAVGLGGLTGSAGAIMNKLADHEWSAAARLLTKEAAKRGIKIGVKGGVAGLAASLAASAIWCATPWA
ncbi:hypothetical protein ABZ383_00820 [Streptomyces sp. NPDC005900]|uniref:hypothetical protein n=1 Tax=Streptomyces sp. NPDC005900 TaxID=3154569 RepID=UPI0034050B5A